jgi:hypothetical protein
MTCVKSFKSRLFDVQANNIIQSLTSSSYFSGKGQQGRQSHGGANYLI